MQALLLATGETLKLRPLTDRIPSPMVPVMNRPIMGYNLELLGRLGFKHILVSVHYLADQIEAYFGDGSRWGLSLEYLLQRDALGSAGSLWWARRRLNEPFLVMPADVIADLEIDKALQEHLAQRHPATVIVSSRPSRGSRTLQVNGERRICAIGDPLTRYDWANTGIYLLDPVVIDRIPPRLPFDLHQDLLPKLLDERIAPQAIFLPGYWNPLETLQDYAEAQREFLAKALNAGELCEEEITYRYCSLESRQIYRGVWVGRNGKIDSSAKINAPACIGNNSWIGREVEIGPGAVIGSNVVIEQGATVQNSTILDGSYVGKLVDLENRLVNQDQLIDWRTHDEVRVTDPLLLSKADLHFLAPGFSRLLEIFLAAVLFITSLPLTLTLGVLLLLTTGRVFQRVPCRPAGGSRSNLHREKEETRRLNLLRFNTRKKNGDATRLGSWMESWEAQRLPELLNVLKGDLALVGSKPEPAGVESSSWIAWQPEQAEARPGFTGMWYVQGNNISEEELIADAYYTATRTWTQDWKILWNTPAAWYQRARSKAAAGLEMA